MALSYSSNWTFQHLNPDVGIFPQTQPELSSELLAFHDEFAVSDTYIDPFFEQEELFYSDNYTYLIPYLSSESICFNSLTPELCTPQDFEPYHCLKRQKFGEDDYSDFPPYYKFVPNPPILQEVSPELLVPLPEFQSPLVYDGGSVGSAKKPSGGTLSAQSIAARERRRKISDRTQELGKLVPGGQKMNTADMFEAAFKYIKYLQAQVGILEFMGSIQDNDEALCAQELQVLLGSPFVQQKLYSAEKCLVPKKFVQNLAEDPELQSDTQVLKGINQLLKTGG
ncbi:unnamed protein product [Ilex paraguariensis]|uniref:BHLH domain-containing protein n=1 Tax=Ilex paraguariensis TaxID=185542 RepID=A0ABC8UB78_9AQUA